MLARQELYHLSHTTISQRAFFLRCGWAGRQAGLSLGLLGTTAAEERCLPLPFPNDRGSEKCN
jgi:hypothetical protein